MELRSRAIGSNNRPFLRGYPPDPPGLASLGPSYAPNPFVSQFSHKYDAIERYTKGSTPQESFLLFDNMLHVCCQLHINYF